MARNLMILAVVMIVGGLIAMYLNKDSRVITTDQIAVEAEGESVPVASSPSKKKGGYSQATSHEPRAKQPEHEEFITDAFTAEDPDELQPEAENPKTDESEAEEPEEEEFVKVTFQNRPVLQGGKYWFSVSKGNEPVTEGVEAHYDGKTHYFVEGELEVVPEISPQSSSDDDAGNLYKKNKKKLPSRIMSYKGGRYYVYWTSPEGGTITVTADGEKFSTEVNVIVPKPRDDSPKYEVFNHRPRVPEGGHAYLLIKYGGEPVTSGVSVKVNGVLENLNDNETGHYVPVWNYPESGVMKVFVDDTFVKNVFITVQGDNSLQSNPFIDAAFNLKPKEE